MIELTTLSGKIFFLNPDLIRSIEQAPDTIICMTDGSRFPVKNTAANIQEKIIQFKRSIYSSASEREL
jgi:flagellar protein FlbD